MKRLFFLLAIGSCAMGISAMAAQPAAAAQNNTLQAAPAHLAASAVQTSTAAPAHLAAPAVQEQAAPAVQTTAPSQAEPSVQAAPAHLAALAEQEQAAPAVQEQAALAVQTTAPSQAAPSLQSSTPHPAEPSLQPAPAPLPITTFRYSGPMAVARPYQLDSVNIQGKKYELAKLLDAKVDLTLPSDAQTITEFAGDKGDALHLLSFSVENNIFAKASLKVEGMKHTKTFMDGKPCEGQLTLEPGTHDFVIKVLTLQGESDTLKVSITPEKENRLRIREDGKHIYDLDINSYGVACGGVSISPSGKYIALGYKVIDDRGKSHVNTEIQDANSGKVLARTTGRVNWMPTRDAYYYKQKTATGNDLVCCYPATQKTEVVCRNVPNEHYTIAPTEDFLIVSLTQRGPKVEEVHQVIVPDDRQPGWRDRSYLAKFDVKTGLMQPLTYGFRNAWLCDIRPDGKKILFMTSTDRLTQRPTTLYSIYELDLATLEAECIIADDGFVSGATYSPDGMSLLVVGSPEALGKVGMDVKEGQIPNKYDIQAYVLDLATKAVTPITKAFDPSVESLEWSACDNKIYLSAEDKDKKSLFRIDPKSAKSEALDGREDYIYGFSMAKNAPTLVYSGQSLCNGDRAYVMNMKTGRQRLLYDFGADRFENTVLGEGGAYEFMSSRGDLINGFYVLPPDFDPNRKYPLLVHYYGGCSPSSRYCIGSYSPHIYAAQGYIFYVINPSGASGFGQEFAARHVNTAGDVVADDIIEGTLNFCKDHPYVDSTRIGCFSASYGGFMTQLLLTKTDIYATGISHAGISDHTSYWGEGYWGYSYSEVSMADSYPWTRRDLYVDRSPLYNADKIHTPLLFLHGSADTNVPIGESIQMFTALKLLGAETAFVVFDGEDHGVIDYDKRREWTRTISAWFAKYLQDDPTWWDTLYPTKNL